LNHDKGLDRIAGSRILLAEDNEVNQQVATELLQSVGLEVVCASHGGEVLELLESQPFDAVLMDIQMPVMDGFETTEAIRRREAEALSLAVPIIALTAHAMQGDREKSLQCGMSDHLTKPLDPEKLFECLVRWITPKNDQSLRQVAKRRKRSGRTTTAAAPTSLPGIDYARALARMGGKHDTFVRLARTFVDQQKDAALRIKTALDKGDTETARAICHSLKGVSGNLGAVDLSAAVDRLGKSIREEGPDAWSQALKQVDDHLDEVVRLFKTLEGETTTSGKLPDHGEQENSASLADALVEMRELIVGKNYRAGKQMSVLHDLARNTQTKKALDDLERCIRSFDFDGALVVTDALLNEEQTDSEDNHGQ
jgi:CheY-like chemotaxis protein